MILWSACLTLPACVDVGGADPRTAQFHSTIYPRALTRYDGQAAWEGFNSSGGGVDQMLGAALYLWYSVCHVGAGLRPDWYNELEYPPLDLYGYLDGQAEPTARLGEAFFVGYDGETGG